MKTPRLFLDRANRPGAVPGLLALVLAVVALIATLKYRDELKRIGEALDAREDVIARQEQKYRAIARAQHDANDTRAAGLMAQQRFATEPARDLIEGGWKPDIALLSVDIVTASRQITLVFETRSVQEAISYADWFQAQPETESVAIKRQVTKPPPPVPSVETTLQVIWRPFAARPADAPAQPASAGAPR
ncbi:hypothetical protein [Caballeronia ptereochthonis]|uniref:Uncharacterized protein n=1 Tax=Caballeronia ptereochthonis TaxID=1777144 RepID=A0A157ZP74_9BURK|nr:hypothetical protein [Caballeronia ptereochthonis]SAK47296.1 hypothetical protein AWB83_00833 [Caballeronia ptereochthonis]